MQKTCAQCGSPFEITPEDLALLDKLSPVMGGKKYPLPAPTLCFDCRLRKRLAFYNCRTLYKRTCDATGKPTLSTFSMGKPFKIFHKDYWWSDAWDPLASGRDVDFSRPIFPQIRSLMEATPQQALSRIGSDVNSDYANDSYKLKNCYLVFDGEQGQSSYHGHTFAKVRDCIDFLSLFDSELCYECLHCQQCYGLQYSRFCTNCSDSWFLRDCIGCKHCFGCANLRQRQYCIFNDQKTKEEFVAFMERFESTKHSAVSEARNRAEEFFCSLPVKATRGEQNIDSSGDNIFQCKDSSFCFDANSAQDCRHCTNIQMPTTRDCLDMHAWGDKVELVYNSVLCGAQLRSIMTGYYVMLGCDSVSYSQWCRSSKNLFGCVGLRHKEHCILNKQYAKEEYERLVPEIIEHMQKTGEWGEYYPPEISAFGYNETMAQVFFPLTREDVLKRGWQWCDEEVSVKAERVIQAQQLPDDTRDIPDDVLNWAIECEMTGKPFKIIKQELEFYRKQEIPLPRRHPDQRHLDRFSMKNPYKLWDRQCAKCQKPIQTSYSPDRSEIVYCENCYLKEVY